MCLMELKYIIYMTNYVLPVISSSERTEDLLTCSMLAFNGGHQSFFYHQQNHQCILQSEKIHVVSDLSVGDGYSYLVQDGPTCGPPPIVVNGNLVSVSEVNGKFMAVYSCNTGFYFTGHKTSTCSETTSTWSTGMQCKSLSTCHDIKSCNPSHTDGEYWLYPDVLNQQKVRFYCYGMTTHSPKEYLSLYGYNVAEYPSGQYASGCQVVSFEKEGMGKTIFTKIRIYPQNLTVMNNDFQFTSNINGHQRSYGMPFACSRDYSDVCPQRGVAQLDISNTGFKFSSNNVWKLIGYAAKFTIVSQTAYTMDLTADGDCGGAETENPLKLERDGLTKKDDDEVDETTRKESRNRPIGQRIRRFLTKYLCSFYDNCM